MPWPRITPDRSSVSSANDNNYQGMIFSPSPGLVVSATQPLPGEAPSSVANKSDSHQEKFSPEPAVLPSFSADMDFPLPSSGAAPPFLEASGAPATPLPQDSPSAGRACNARGQQPIRTNNLHPTERAWRIKIMSEHFDLEFNNAIASPRWLISVMCPRLANLMGLPFYDLPPERVKRVVSPRGCIRPTRIVCFSCQFPGLQVEHQWERIWVYVLNDDDPDIGVPLIIGRPWLEDPQWEKYVRGNITNDQNTTFYLDSGTLSNVKE